MYRHTILLLFASVFFPSVYSACVDPNSTVIESPAYLATDKSHFDDDRNLHLAFEWLPVNTRYITDISLDGDSNCSYYGILSNWTYYLDATSSCNNGVQAIFNWNDLYYSCKNSFNTVVLATVQQIQLSFTITMEETVSTPTGPIVRTITSTVPFQIDLPTTASLTFGAPLYVVPNTAGVRVIVRFAGNLADFDSLSFVQAVSNFTGISAYRIVLVKSNKRDFSTELLIQPGPPGEPTPNEAASALTTGVNDGSFGNNATSTLTQNYAVTGVITTYASTNTSLYRIHFRTFVANFPTPAGVTPDAISFSQAVTSITIVETGSIVSGNFYVQDWDVYIVPGAGCYVRGAVSINFNFTGADPSTVTISQFSVDSSNTCPSVINPTSLQGTIFSYTDSTLNTKSVSFRQHDVIFFQAKITNNKLPIIDDGLTITKIEYKLGSDPVQTLMEAGSTNFTGLAYGHLESGSAATVWWTITPEAFPILDQYSVYTFYFSLAVVYQQNKKRAEPLARAVLSSNLIFQQNNVVTPSSSQSNSMTRDQMVQPDHSASTKLIASLFGAAILCLAL